MVKIDENAEFIYNRMLQYREDIEGFAVETLGLNPEYIWSKMREVWDAAEKYQLIAIRACHSVSKTFNMGRVIVPWFKTCFQPSTVVTTAPSDNQVRNQLWREIHAAFASARIPLGGTINALSWDHKPTKEVLDSLSPEEKAKWEKNFAIGFATSPDSVTEHATKMQGWHNEWFLAVIDEACGIMPQIWRTILESLIVDERCRCIAVGNPTDPESDFAKACHSSNPENNEGNKPYISDEGWYVITIQAYDTPNYIEGKRIIPGLAGRDFVDRITKKYGPDGDGTRIRVKGLFPTYKEGTYYGSRLATARKEGRIGRFPHDQAAKVYTFNDFGDMYTGTIFVQFIRSSVRIIDDYWDYEGLGLPAWAKMCQSKGYVYGEHYAGPDLIGSNSKSVQTGKTMRDVAAELGFNLLPTIQCSFDDGIEAVRTIWHKLEIDEKCGTFLKAASGYGKKKNAALSTDDQIVYHDSPLQSWHRHLMDALRHLAIAYYHMEIGGESLGFARPEHADREIEYADNDFNPLSLGSL